LPEFSVKTSGGKIADIKIIRGAPCGATWKASERVLNLSLQDAVEHIGLETQFFCKADPSGWDPIYGKSPVHLAGELHKTALSRDITVHK
jgi:thymidylate synthase